MELVAEAHGNMRHVDIQHHPELPSTTELPHPQYPPLFPAQIHPLMSLRLPPLERPPMAQPPKDIPSLLSLRLPRPRETADGPAVKRHESHPSTDVPKPSPHQKMPSPSCPPHPPTTTCTQSTKTHMQVH